MRLPLLLAATLCLTAACGGSGSTDTAGPSAETTVVPLQPTAADGAATTVLVPATSAQVQFLLAGIDRPSDALTAELERVGADQIRRWPVVDVPAGANGVTHAVTVPIYEARPGDYVLTVWAGDVEVVRRYRYTVTAPAK